MQYAISHNTEPSRGSMVPPFLRYGDVLTPLLSGRCKKMRIRYIVLLDSPHYFRIKYCPFKSALTCEPKKQHTVGRSCYIYFE